MLAFPVFILNQSHKGLLDWLPALLTPSVALLAVVVAVAQWRIARNKWRLDLYEKRYATYREIMRFAANVCIYGTPAKDEVLSFQREASLHQFLFDQSIKAYVDQMAEHAREMRKKDEEIEMMQHSAQEPSRQRLARERSLVSEWFRVQLEVAPIIFEKYLGFRKP